MLKIGMLTSGGDCQGLNVVHYTHLRSYETLHNPVCRLLRKKKNPDPA